MFKSQMLIFLVRHGQTDWNYLGKWQGHVGPGLNRTGIDQIETAAEKLRRYEIGVIVSSDTLRARESALILGNRLRISSIFYEERLRERSMGNLVGLTETEILRKHPEIKLTKGLLGNNNIEAAEPWEDFIHRSTSTFLELAKEHDENTVIVTHGGVIDQLITFITGDDSYPIVSNGNVSLVDVDKLSGAMKLLHYSI
jgi:probable phosphoglycerate mutase